MSTATTTVGCSTTFWTMGSLSTTQRPQMLVQVIDHMLHYGFHAEMTTMTITMTSKMVVFEAKGIQSTTQDQNPSLRVL